eukprot:TRINITY_DN2090_c0_g1_i1.p1 TRINITY_DN2090_c0_g1~~TRINITY_DN2090_c0_g1_i1.p1  ORF type:complete len:457 (-),score=101.68 TRINITY_DN2090_c0_g1_i1:22-1392(-)
MEQVVSVVVEATESSSEHCWDRADTAWVTIASILVMGMMPALAFFEAGMLRSKNTLSILTQVLAGLSVLQIIWHFFGFSWVFDQGKFLGGFRYIAYHKLLTECVPSAPHIPGLTFAIFESMFAAITPLLITGAFAERMKFKPFLAFIIAWEILVYYPLAHWIWGGGWLQQMGVLDFAGGIVIHTSAGTASLVVAYLLGPRLDFEKYEGEFPPHNLPLATVGAGLLWLGWYGFNAGSALTIGPVAANAISTTTVAASSSAAVWMILSYVKHKRPHTVAILNGVLAGLAGITPASGYIPTPYASVVGVILGFVSWYGIVFFKGICHIDDALDVSSVHGLTGLVGSLAIGVFASKDVNGYSGLIDGEGKLLGLQCLGVVVTIAWAGAWTWIIIKTLEQVRRFTGYCAVRVNEADEIEGLDRKEHGHTAYIDLVLDDIAVHGDYHTINDTSPHSHTRHGH